MLNVHLSEAVETLDKLIRRANEDNHPIEIICTKSDNRAVLISKKYWDAIQVTLYLQYAGVPSKTKQFEDEETEGLNDINCYTLDSLLRQCYGENPTNELFSDALGKE